MVIDAKTGRMLHGVNENALRHPASITKVMTLYMLFEQMERGRFRMDSPLRVSSYAASRPPSKIGVDAGETIEVEDAIKALITKSANDVAVVVAENIAGDEDTFAEQMTRRARSLGMTRTVFQNASGLPDAEQVTTARDLTILARAIQERFPRQYQMFQTRNFAYAGRNYRNHNKLLGRVEGVDGIKTGYTRMSGFNLMTSAKADGRHIVSIVLGGRSGRVRDNIMAGLVVAHLPRASSGPRTSLVAQVPETERQPETQRTVERTPERASERVRVAVAEPVRAAEPAAAPAPQPVPVARPVARPIDLASARPISASAAADAFAAPTPTSTSFSRPRRRRMRVLTAERSNLRPTTWISVGTPTRRSIWRKCSAKLWLLHYLHVSPVRINKPAISAPTLCSRRPLRPASRCTRPSRPYVTASPDPRNFAA
jgi:D-alanyl-D-alanine carboxypeptidase